jgi:hypothetical protein
LQTAAENPSDSLQKKRYLILKITPYVRKNKTINLFFFFSPTSFRIGYISRAGRSLVRHDCCCCLKTKQNSALKNKQTETDDVLTCIELYISPRRHKTQTTALFRFERTPENNLRQTAKENTSKTSFRRTDQTHQAVSHSKTSQRFLSAAALPAVFLAKQFFSQK